MKAISRVLFCSVVLLVLSRGNASAILVANLAAGNATLRDKPDIHYHEIVVKDTEITVDGVAPGTRRLFIPRDSQIVVKNESNISISVKANDEPVVEVQPGSKLALFAARRSDFLLSILNSNLEIATFEVLVAKRLEIFGKVGAGLTLTTGSDFAGYKLQTDPGSKTSPDDDKQRIFRSDSRAITGTFVGQIFVAFDDEMGLGRLSKWVSRSLTLGLFDPCHHRFGLVASVATADATDPTYQLGFAWFLDRQAKCVFSYGFQFRQRERLLFGLGVGDEFGGSVLPTQKEWKSNFFIGLTFNLGNGS